MAMNLNDLYQSLIETAGLYVTEDGYVKRRVGKDDTENVIVGGKALVLPTDAHLSNPKWDNRVVFHPLMENVMRGESEVLGKFREFLNLRLNIITGSWMLDLLEIAASQPRHENLNPEQSEYLSLVKKPDAQMFDTLAKLIKAAPYNDLQRSFVHIYLKKGGKIGKDSFKRLGVVSFPFYHALKQMDKDHVFGVKLRKKDQEAYLALLEYIFPNIGEAGAYNRGSNAVQAPSLDALMKAAAAIIDPLSNLLELFRNQVPEEQQPAMTFNDDWADTFQNIDVMAPQARAIPMMMGNEGAGKGGPAAEAQPAAAAQPVVQPTAQPQPQQPQVQQTWEPPRPPQQPSPYAYNPGYQPPQQPPVAPVKTADGKLNFEAMVQTNPALAQQVQQGAMQFGGYAPPQPMYPPQERVPRWAQQPAPYPQQPYYGQPAPYPQQPGYGVPLQGNQGVMYPQQPWEAGIPHAPGGGWRR